MFKKPKKDEKIPPLYALSVILLASLISIWYVNRLVSKETSFSQDTSSGSSPSIHSSLSSSGTARLLLDFGDGKKRKFEGEVTEGMNAYDALLVSAEVGGFAFESETKDEGPVIHSIDGKESSDEGKKWHLYVNGVYHNFASPGTVEIHSGDQIEYRYE